MYTGRRCADFGVLDDGQVVERFSAEGMCCDKPLAYILHLSVQWVRTLDKGKKKAYRANHCVYSARHLHVLFRRSSNSLRLRLKVELRDRRSDQNGRRPKRVSRGLHRRTGGW